LGVETGPGATKPGHPPAAAEEVEADPNLATGEGWPASAISPSSWEPFQRVAKAAELAAELDVKLFANWADGQTVALRSQSSALGEAVGQLAELLESNEARTLLEAAFRLREAVEVYQPTGAPQEVSKDEPERNSLELEIQMVRRARAAHNMVLGSLVASWTMLEALNEIFRGRVGECDAAKSHITAKQRSDLLASLDATANDVKQAVGDLDQRNARIKEQAAQLEQLR
jgi:hypothetical protein